MLFPPMFYYFISMHLNAIVHDQIKDITWQKRNSLASRYCRKFNSEEKSDFPEN
jgi:hypothetical protein